MLYTDRRRILHQVFTVGVRSSSRDSRCRSGSVQTSGV